MRREPGARAQGHGGPFRRGNSAIAGALAHVSRGIHTIGEQLTLVVEPSLIGEPVAALQSDFKLPVFPGSRMSGGVVPGKFERGVAQRGLRHLRAI